MKGNPVKGEYREMNKRYDLFNGSISPYRETQKHGPIQIGRASFGMSLRSIDSRWVKVANTPIRRI